MIWLIATGVWLISVAVILFFITRLKDATRGLDSEHDQYS